MIRFGGLALAISSLLLTGACGDDAGGSPGSARDGDSYHSPAPQNSGAGGSGGSGGSGYTGSQDSDGYWYDDGSGAVSGDKYETAGTNPFVFTAFDPLSTFAADVDTASYDIFRRDAEYNRLPHKDSVRLEEFINYFKYDYDGWRCQISKSRLESF